MAINVRRSVDLLFGFTKVSARRPVSAIERRPSVEGGVPVYDWIIEADIYRLNKELRDTTDKDRRQRIEFLIKRKAMTLYDEHMLFRKGISRG